MIIFIVFRYQETGSIRPGVLGSGRSKQNVQEVGRKIIEYKVENPEIFSNEIQNLLIKVTGLLVFVRVYSKITSR